MNRRNFLGWLGATSGTVAIYKQTAIPEQVLKPALAPADLDRLVEQSPASCYVIRNEGERPMVVNYKRDGSALDLARTKRASHHVQHISTLLLPGEELTITAVPAKV
jgi:hypothetical protein